MPGRFLFRKFSSRMPRSTSLPSAYASASTAAGEATTRRAWEGGISNIRYLFGAASGHCSTAAPNLPRAHAARYLNTLPCTRVASAVIGSTATGMPSAIPLKPAFISPIGGKQTFSSTNDTISSKPMPTTAAQSEAKWDNDKAVMEAKLAAWSAKQDAEDAAFGRYLMFLMVSWGFIFYGLISMMDSGPSHGDQTTYEVQSSSHCCSSCCKCQCADQNPKTE